MENQDEIEENNEIKLVEEYHEKIEEYKRIADDREKLLRHLKAENETLIKKSHEDSTLLQDKVVLCEKLKRDIKNLEKENIKFQKKSKMTPSEVHATRIQAAREGRSGYITQKEQRRDDLKNIIKHGRKVKKHQEWLSKELGNTIENFNEMFINNLSLSLTQIFVDKDKKLKQQEEPKYEFQAEEDEEEEEEGDHIFDVEVVNQKSQDANKAYQVDNSLSITEDNDNDEENKVDPNAEQNIDEAIDNNNEAKVKDKEMKEQLKEQEKAVIKIEGSLQERERLLEAVKESHALMQNTILEEMKKEYQKKVVEMEYEINKLKSDHKLSIRSASTSDKTSLEAQYKQRLAELESKFLLYKAKEKEQKKMEREALKQSNKIKVLENDIQKVRTQKVTLNRKLKEFDEKYRKWKITKGSELLNIKKISVKKDRQINELKREKRKNELLAQKNAAELKLLKKKNKEEATSRKKEDIKRRKRMKVSKKVTNKAGVSTENEISIKHDQSVPIEIDKVRTWIEANVEKMVTIKHLQKDLHDFEYKRQQIEAEIDEEQRYYSEISIRKEKAIMAKSKLRIDEDEGEALSIERDISEYDAILNKNQENIESLEDKIEFYNKKIINIENAIDDVNNEDIKGLNLDKVDSMQNAKTLLVAFFNIVLEVKVQRMDLEETLVDQHNSIQEFEKELKILRDSKRSMELEFNRALQKREKEFQELETKLIEETEDKINQSKLNINTPSSLTSLESKRLQKKQKNEKNNSTEAYEDSKRKLSKMMSQLEKKLALEEKKNMAMSNIIEQSKAEKDQYKQRYTNLKNKIKQDEISQMRMNKMASMESTPYGISAIPEGSNHTHSKLTDYKDMRKDRKIVKNKVLNEQIGGNSNTDGITNFLGSDMPGSKDTRSSMHKMRQATSMEQTNSNVFDRLMSHSTITSKIKEKPPITHGDDSEPTTPQYKGRSASFNYEIEGIDQSELLWN